MKALSEIGLLRAVKFAFCASWEVLLGLAVLPPVRALLMRIAGTRIGAGSVLMRLRLFNLDRGGFRALRLGRDCFIGDETVVDLAGTVTLGDQVTIAERVLVLTHLNVGYRDHPLRRLFPSSVSPVVFRRGCFVGAGSVILPGVTVGERAFVAAGSVVIRSVPPQTLVAGVPARAVRRIGPRRG